jgi:hypothetical protein
VQVLVKYFDSLFMRSTSPAVVAVIAGWGAVAFLALLVWSLPHMPEPFWPLPLIVAAVPLAIHLVEWRLMKRRAMLSALTHDTGLVRALFWKGRLLQTGAVFVAVMGVMALFMAASFLQWHHWMTLTVYVVVLAIVVRPVREALKSQVSSAHLAMVARHGPLFWGGVLVLGLAFLALNFVLDQPDLRAASFQQVLAEAYQEGSQGPKAASLAMLLGVTNAARMGLWYWAQIVGPQLDTGVAWMFWLVFLLIIGGIASLVNAYLLAVIGLAERIRLPASSTPSQPFRIGLTAAVLVFGVIHVFATYGPPRQPLGVSLQEARIIAHLDPCGSANSHHAVASLTEDLLAASDRELSRTQGEIGAAVNSAFATLDPAIDAYLDWHFSLMGEYSRLGHALLGDASAFMVRKFEEIVLAEGSFEARLGERLGAIEARSNARMEKMAARHVEGLHGAVETNRCLAVSLPAFEHPAIVGGLGNVSGAVAGGAVGITAGVMIGARLGPTVARRVGAKGLLRPASAALGKTAVTRGPSAAGAAAVAAACASSGPGAVLCGAVTGIGLWIGVDALVLRVDEYLNRDGMRAEIVGALDASRQELIESLTAADAARIHATAGEVSRIGRELFSPSYEGLGRPRQ